LECDEDRRHRPVPEHFLNLPCQPVASGLGILDSVDVILQHDLLGRMLETHRGQPAPKGLGASPAVDAVMTQQKALQMPRQ
jgi:hypothetical protein